MAESCWCESFCHQTALKSITRSEKNNSIISESKFNLDLTCFHKNLCVISQQKWSFSFKIFLILRSLHTAKGDKSWHSITASTGHPVLVVFLDYLGHLWHWSEWVSQSVSQSVRRGVSEWVTDWLTDRLTEWFSQSEGEWVSEWMNEWLSERAGE